MSILYPPPPDPYERALDTTAINRMLSERLVNLLVAAWVDDGYPEARDDVRVLMHAFQNGSTQARLDGDQHEAGGQERAREHLVELWARATDRLLGSHTGLPQWDGIVDRLSVR